MHMLCLIVNYTPTGPKRLESPNLDLSSMLIRGGNCGEKNENTQEVGSHTRNLLSFAKRLVSVARQR